MTKYHGHPSKKLPFSGKTSLIPSQDPFFTQTQTNIFAKKYFFKLIICILYTVHAIRGHEFHHFLQHEDHGENEQQQTNTRFFGAQTLSTPSVSSGSPEFLCVRIIMKIRDSPRIIRWDPRWREQTSCKSIVIFRNIPLKILILMEENPAPHVWTPASWIFNYHDQLDSIGAGNSSIKRGCVFSLEKRLFGSFVQLSE